MTTAYGNYAPEAFASFLAPSEDWETSTTEQHFILHEENAKTPDNSTQLLFLRMPGLVKPAENTTPASSSTYSARRPFPNHFMRRLCNETSMHRVLPSCRQVTDTKHLEHSHLYDIYTSSMAKPEGEALRSIFSKIFDLIQDRDLDTLDRIFGEAQPSKLKDLISVGLLRSTLKIKSKTPNWQIFFVETWLELEKKGKNPKTLLRGLYNPNEPISRQIRKSSI